MISLTNKLPIMLASMMCLTLLTACNETQIKPMAAAVSNAGNEAARRAEIVRQLRAICPTENQWTPVQKRTVAAFIRKYAQDPGLQLLARDWQRITNGARICRGVS